MVKRLVTFDLKSVLWYKYQMLFVALGVSSRLRCVNVINESAVSICYGCYRIS